MNNNDVFISSLMNEKYQFKHENMKTYFVFHGNFVMIVKTEITKTNPQGNQSELYRGSCYSEPNENISNILYLVYKKISETRINIIHSDDNKFFEMFIKNDNNGFRFLSDDLNPLLNISQFIMTRV